MRLTRSIFNLDAFESQDRAKALAYRAFLSFKLYCELRNTKSAQEFLRMADADIETACQILSDKTFEEEISYDFLSSLIYSVR